MRRLTPAGVSTMMVVVVVLLVTAYFAKLMRAEEPRSQPIASSPSLAPSQAIEFRAVPIAAGQLPPGTVIAAGNLATQQVRGDNLPSDAVIDQRTLIGRTVKERIAAGTVIRSSQLNPTGERPQPTVTRGMRAVSIALRRGVAPINGLKEGQYVDVYLTPRGDATNDARLHGGLTLTLFRGVRLLSVNVGASANDTDDVATLELAPAQATALILARERGNIALAYNPEGKGDGGIALKDRDRATFDEILGLPPDPAATAGPAGTFTTEVYKGTTRSMRQFDGRTKVEPVPAASSPTNAWRVPLWTRKSSDKPGHVPPPERISIVPDQSTFR